MKIYMKTEYEDMLKWFTDRSFEKYIISIGKKESDSDMASLLANPKFREYTGNCEKEEEEKQENY
jgi:N-acetylglutamate synthase/N-acetylornithine aminotransferase